MLQANAAHPIATFARALGRQAFSVLDAKDGAGRALTELCTNHNRSLLNTMTSLPTPIGRVPSITEKKII